MTQGQKVYTETILGSASYTFSSYLALISLRISPGHGGARRRDYVYQFLACPQVVGVGVAGLWPQIKILGKVCHSVGSYHQVCDLCQVLWLNKISWGRGYDVIGKSVFRRFSLGYYTRFIPG